MVFDSTIMAIRISDLTIAFTTGGATLGLRSFGFALMMGHENLDAADITDHPELSSIGPPWMWHSLRITLVPASVNTVNLSIVSGSFHAGVLVKAKRRLTENNKELFLVSHNTVIAADDSNLSVSGYFRTLIRIP